MSRRWVFGALSCLLALGLAFAPAALADSQVRIVRLSQTQGPVQIDRATGQGFEKAIMNMPITRGTRLQTGDNGRAEVEFEDGTALRLAPASQVEFTELSLRSSGGRASAVRVDQGTVYFNVRHKRDDDFRVSFANQELAVDKTVHFRLALDSGEAAIAVFKGELDLRGPAEQAKVKKDETLSLPLSDSGRYELAKGISTEPDDSWDDERLNYVSEYARSGYSGQSPYSYGMSDLNYYGAWGNYPGYGTLWRPYGVGYGWDPFNSGAWAWYPGFGYTWVSTYPWGWTPYRYGSWTWVPSYGWAWAPGAWNTWYTVPRVVNAPPAYKPPRPPLWSNFSAGQAAPTVPSGTAVIYGSGPSNSAQPTGAAPTVMVGNGANVTASPRPRMMGGRPVRTQPPLWRNAPAPPAGSNAQGRTAMPSSPPARVASPPPARSQMPASSASPARSAPAPRSSSPPRSPQK
ncbi:MAG: FecR domain-containing protein [Terriglobales bacterium]